MLETIQVVELVILLAVFTVWVGTSDIEFELVTQHLEGTQASCDFLFAFLERFVAELEDLAAIRTDQVIVNVRLAEERVEPGNAVTEVSWLSQSIFDQDLEGPVDRRVADPRIVVLDDVVEFLDADVLVEFEECGDDKVALPGRLESRCRSTTSKFFECLGDFFSAQTLRLVDLIGIHLQGP